MILSITRRCWPPVRTEFMLPSSSHCKSSRSASDKRKTAPNGCRLSDHANRLEPYREFA